MVRNLIDHEWHDDIGWNDLPDWIRGNSRRMVELRHGKELRGRNVVYKIRGGRLMRKLRRGVPVVVEQVVGMSGSQSITSEATTGRGNRLTGSSDAIFLKAKYQKLLDGVYDQLTKHVEFLNAMNRKAQGPMSAARALESDILAYEKERADLYASLNTALDKELGQALAVGKSSRQGLKVDTKQGLGTGGGLFGAGSIELRYLEQYPRLSSDSRFQKMTESIVEKESDIRKKKEEYNEQARQYNHELTYFPKNIEIADGIVSEYNRILVEGSTLLKSSRYVRGVWYKLATERDRQRVTLELDRHQIAIQKGLIDSFRIYNSAIPLAYYSEGSKV